MEYFNLTSLTHGEIVLSTGAPRLLQEKVMNNSSAAYAQGSFGLLQFQEIVSQSFRIRYNIYRIEESFQLTLPPNPESLVLFIGLKNDLSLDINASGETALKEGQFIIACAEGFEITIHGKHAGEYESFEVYLPVTILDDFKEQFPGVRSAEKRHSSGKTVFLAREPGWINSKIFTLVTEFIECNYSEEVRHKYFEILIRELLLLLLLQTQKRQDDYNSYMQNLYEARYVVEKNPAAHFTISELADRVGLNENRLKSGFKQHFGVEIGDFIIQAKMQKAYVWVVDTDKPFKEIAQLTGYTTLQNFATAFRRYFNATPGTVRKKFRHMN